MLEWGSSVDTEKRYKLFYKCFFPPKNSSVAPSQEKFSVFREVGRFYAIAFRPAANEHFFCFPLNNEENMTVEEIWKMRKITFSLAVIFLEKTENTENTLRGWSDPRRLSESYEMEKQEK